MFEVLGQPAAVALHEKLHRAWSAAPQSSDLEFELDALLADLEEESRLVVNGGGEVVTTREEYLRQSDARWSKVLAERAAAEARQFSAWADSVTGRSAEQAERAGDA